MPKHNILRSIYLNVGIPEDLRAKLDLHLFSSVEGRVPKGAYQKLISELLTKFLNHNPDEISDAEAKQLSPRFQRYHRMQGLLVEIARSESVYAARARAVLRGGPQ